MLSLIFPVSLQFLILDRLLIALVVTLPVLTLVTLSRSMPMRSYLVILLVCLQVLLCAYRHSLLLFLVMSILILIGFLYLIASLGSIGKRLWARINRVLGLLKLLIVCLVLVRLLVILVRLPSLLVI